MEGLFRRRRLPHWDVADATYFVTACLAGSIPAQGYLRLREYQEQLDAKSPPAGMNGEEWELHKQKMLFEQFDRILDLESPVRWLERDDLADVVMQGMLHFDAQRYDVLAFVVMPSHFHWVFKPRSAYWQGCGAEERTPREAIMHSVKSFTAKACNRLLGLSGEFWQAESYDHVVRGDDELERIIQYVEQNPIKAGLVARAVDWRWSSAYRRRP